ncbi:MAG: PstS family phosphate ABC transporter substrate-binding protein [Cyanobacteria bacterium CRU_2_1]|nr:PstS family phosphate ABC transporter substrate-binding protein [Cyanobacteria bacterium RU_5_0]NJR63437.1 PstS family phosphate ABC transporter substrate-binding protein [Cyanobacteria bacterium CRU_2_1]
MFHRKETAVLVSLLLITSGLIVGGFWWAGGWSSLGRSNTREELQQNEQEKAKTFAEVLTAPSGLFNYGGSTTWAPLRVTVDPVIQTSLPQFRLRYINPSNGKPGSGSGIKMLLEGQLAFAQSSRPLEQEEYQQAQQRGFTLEQIPVAIDGIAIVVHPNLNIPGITIAQLKDIYTGKLNNWSQLGGADLPITPYSRSRAAGGTVEFFVDNVLEGEELGSNVKIVDDTTVGLREVSADPGGIYYATAIEVVPQCKVKPLAIGHKPDQLVPPYQEPLVEPSQCPEQRNRLNNAAIQSGEYPITRRLFVIIKQNGQVDEQAGRAYADLLLSDQGQELINSSGFISIR